MSGDKRCDPAGPVTLGNLLDFRQRWPHLTPFRECLCNGEVVEVVSFPWPDGDTAAVNVRMVSGDCTTMQTVQADETAALSEEMRAFRLEVAAQVAYLKDHPAEVSEMLCCKCDARIGDHEYVVNADGILTHWRCNLFEQARFGPHPANGREPAYESDYAAAAEAAQEKQPCDRFGDKCIRPDGTVDIDALVKDLLR